MTDGLQCISENFQGNTKCYRESVKLLYNGGDVVEGGGLVVIGAAEPAGAYGVIHGEDQKE